MRSKAERTRTAMPARPAPNAELAAEPGDIAGFRVVRRLAAGRSSTVYLGHAAQPAARPGAGVSDGHDSTVNDTVALRVFHSDAEPERVDREIALLGALPAGVGAALHDVVTLPDGRLCLVLQRDDGPTVAQLLQRRAQIRAGEAVTILAPLILAVDGLHRQGWSHGALSSASVRFDATGRTHLCAWGGARPLEAGAQRTATLRTEYAGLAGIAREVCAAVDGGSAAPHEVTELLDWLDERVGAHPFLPCAAEFERRLFALARPLPVRLTVEASVGAAESAQPAVPMRLTGQPAVAAGGAVIGAAGGLQGTDDPDRPPAALWAGWGLPAELGRAARGTRSALHARLRAHRSPLVASVALAAGLFVLAITLLPPGPERSQAAATPPPAGPTVVEPAANDPATSGPAANDPAAVEPEMDPVLAAAQLLAAREDCHRQSSLLCLDGVLDSGGPLAAADAAEIRRAQVNGTPLLPDPLDPGTLTLVEQNGGAALLALTGAGDNAKPASLLMIRGEAGWRLRELFDY